MKDSSQLRKQFDKLKEAYENAQKRKKKAKSAYKSQMKASKSQVKPYRLSYKQAQLAEHEAKVEYKALLKELKRYEDDGFGTTREVAEAPSPVERKRRGRKPGTKMPVAEEKPAGRGRGRRKAVAVAAPSGEGDDLTRVNGVGGKVSAVLQANGIQSFEDMAATSLERYKQILKENGMGMFRNPSTWAQQAADLAGVKVTAPAPAPPAPKEPKRRGRKPGAPKAVAPKTGKRGRKPGAAKAAAEKPAAQRGAPRRRAAETATGGGDDLTRVVGVGDKVAVALRANGVSSFADMAATPLARYKEILKENGMSKFRNPTTWAQQAADFAGVEAVREQPTPAAPPKEKGRRGRKPMAKPVAIETAEEPKRRGRKPGFKPTPKVKAAAVAETAATESEPVKKRRGRQPGFKPTPKAKTAAVVAAPVAEAEPAKKRRGRQPGFKPAPRVKTPTSAAPVIAESLQRSRGATKKGAQIAPAPAPRNIPGSVQVDDLTKIKGIGDRVQTALNDFGIYSYADVAGTSLDRFKEILKARGMSKFRDPSSWAQGASEFTGR